LRFYLIPVGIDLNQVFQRKVFGRNHHGYEKELAGAFEFCNRRFFYFSEFFRHDFLITNSKLKDHPTSPVKGENRERELALLRASFGTFLADRYLRKIVAEYHEFVEGFHFPAKPAFEVDFFDRRIWGSDTFYIFVGHLNYSFRNNGPPGLFFPWRKF
jgi:hypothetical protein